jgi:hypothetical protein
MVLRLEFSAKGNPYEHKTKKAKTGPGSRHQEVVSLAETGCIQQERKISALHVGMLPIGPKRKL